MTESTSETTSPNPQAKAAKKSASKPKPAKAEKTLPPPSILFGPANTDLNPAYKLGEE